MSDDGGELGCPGATNKLFIEGLNEEGQWKKID
jgi:hypothetical protein